MDFYTSDGVLYHHGIKNQKWGVKHGPPYPLSDKQKSKAEKKEAKANKKKYGMTKEQASEKLSQPYEGNSWREVRSKVQKVMDNDSTMKKLLKESDDLYNKIENEYSKDDVNMTDSEFINHWKTIDNLEENLNQVNNQIANWSKEIATSFSNEFKEAALKDINYDDIELGKEMLKTYNLEEELKKSM